MSIMQDRFNAGEQARKRIKLAAIDRALTEQAHGLLGGMSVTDRIDHLTREALHRADEGAHSGMVWSYAATLAAQAMEAIVKDLRERKS